MTSAVQAPAGSQVTVTVDPDLGKQLDLDSLNYNDGSNVPIIQQYGEFSFNLPDHDVTISSAIFNSPADWTDVNDSNDEFCENLVQAEMMEPFMGPAFLTLFIQYRKIKWSLDRYSHGRCH